jgi:uncharacterized membrane protein SpoIIM required for sporulation/ABC-type transport system involved in multi-copper enzyme maturation permease subunit
MRASLQPVWIVAWREMRDQFRDWRIIFPIVALTLFFPFLMNFTARRMLNFMESYGAELVAERFIPFLLMIVGFFPITVSLVIALESFAGETERHSIEPLLGSPLTDWQLYWGKLIASLVPPTLASYLGVTVYMAGIYRSTDWRAPASFIVLVICLVAVQALVMVSGAVVVSTQTTSVRAANLLASFIVVPMAILIQAESVVMLWADYSVLWWAVLGQLVLGGLLVRMGLAHFNREELLGREIDVLSFNFAGRVFWRAFVGQARHPFDWLRREVPASLRRLTIPVVIAAVLLLGSLWIGMNQVERIGIAPEMLNLDQLGSVDAQVLEQLKGMGFFSLIGASMVWMHNLRAVLIACLIGTFTFGVGGILILMLPLALIGFLSGAAALVGVSSLTFMAAFTMPHGLLEVPAMILAGAAILKVGATFVTPAQGMSIGESWLRAMADWARVMVAVVMPLFLGAALLEIYVSPRFVVMLLGG